jgi:hypothetical protein
MIRVFVEVTEEAVPLKVEVCAESISKAVDIVEELHPGHAVQVVFPIDPQEFFVEGSEQAGTKQDQSRTLVHASIR